MAREATAIIEDIEFGQDRLHAKWWEIASWLADQRGDDPRRLSSDQRIAYAAQIRELTDDWGGADPAAPIGKPLNATTDLQRLLAEYYDLTELLGGYYHELDALDDEDD